ncbi:hypothetical protein Tco_0103954 [Tanacetum coccineum]
MLESAMASLMFFGFGSTPKDGVIEKICMFDDINMTETMSPIVSCTGAVTGEFVFMLLDVLSGLSAALYIGKGLWDTTGEVPLSNSHEHRTI